GHGISWNRLV
ncbi:hypothetical protein CP03DC29_0401B, partial [Chlamydia psittaci 03DC29]